VADVAAATRGDAVKTVLAVLLAVAEQDAVMATMVELTEVPDSPGLNVHRVGDHATKC
jgi:hypothetical protein